MRVNLTATSGNRPRSKDILARLLNGGKSTTIWIFRKSLKSDQHSIGSTKECGLEGTNKAQVSAI
jgi:hypothetical protein